MTPYASARFLQAAHTGISLISLKNAENRSAVHRSADCRFADRRDHRYDVQKMKSGAGVATAAAILGDRTAILADIERSGLMHATPSPSLKAASAWSNR